MVRRLAATQPLNRWPSSIRNPCDVSPPYACDMPSLYISSVRCVISIEHTKVSRKQLVQMPRNEIKSVAEAGITG